MSWLKLHRQFTDWEWYTHLPTKTVFMHLLLTANIKEKRFRGHVIPVGSSVTGLHALSEQTGLSVQQVRTALKNLKSTNEITVRSTNSFSIISITKWCEYQGDQQATNNQSTNGQQATNNQSTTPKEGKNIEGKNKDSFVETPPDQLVDDWNEICGDVLPKVVRLTPERKNKLKKRLSEDFQGERGAWQAYCRRIRGSPFLTGERGWKADFDWVLQPANTVKILEGNYDEKFRGASGGLGTGSGRTGDQQMGVRSANRHTGNSVDDQAARIKQRIREQHANATDCDVEGLPENENASDGYTAPVLENSKALRIEG